MKDNNTGNEPTDLREAFTLYDLRGWWANTHDKEIILRQINKKVRKDYILKSEAISRKDAVSKSEVSRKRNELSVDRDGWVKEHIEDLEILLTEVDKPNKS